MAMQQTYRCPKCTEAFVYAPSERARHALEESEMTSAKPGMLMINCFHCPASLLVRPSDCSCLEFTMEAVERLGGVKEIGTLFHDMSATEKVQEEVEHLNLVGDQLSRAGKPREALATFEKALSLRKHNPEAWYNKGVCLEKLGDRAGALTAIRHAAELKPDMVQAWNNLGTLLCQAGQFAEAEPYFDRGLEADPNYPKFYLGKANCLLMRGEAEEGVRMLYTALEKDPSYAPARQMLARLGVPS